MIEEELNNLDEQVVKSSQVIGRKLKELVLRRRLNEWCLMARHQGSYGQVQQLVGERPKQVITLVGLITPILAKLNNPCSFAGAC